MRANVLLIFLLLPLSACGTAPQFTNQINPSASQTQFNKDFYECQRENERQAAAITSVYTGAAPVVDKNKVQSCMAARGWQEVPRSFWENTEYYLSH